MILYFLNYLDTEDFDQDYIQVKFYLILII